MGLDDLRKRLEALNRSALPASTESAGEAGEKRHPGDARLDTLIPGRSVEVDGASLYVIDRCLSDPGESGVALFERFTAAMTEPAARRRAATVHDELVALLEADAEDLLFVDLETCGFSGTPVFLIGVLYVTSDGFHVEQLLARNYDEEAGILARFGQLVSDRPHLVTFNGKSFDWPFVSARAAIARIEFAGLAGHCDLLHVGRRRFGDVLPDCKLQTIERYISGRQRVGDIPGRDIPAAYHGFVDSGNAFDLRDIVRHNFLDLVTLTEMIPALVNI